MPTTLPSASHRRGGAPSRLESRLLAAYGVSLVTLSGLIVINGPQMRAAAEAQEARIVEEENRAFCGKLGIDPGTSRQAECAAGLAVIRARALERSAGNSIL
jgi:hypothetical protein